MIEDVSEKMSGSSKICVSCGACCDGTLFSSAKLKPDDDLSYISEAGTAIISKSDARRFLLPCAALENRCCQIYHLTRPSICSKFRCKTLKNYESRQITLETALSRVERLKELTGIFRKEVSLIVTNAEQMPVRKLAGLLPDDKLLRKSAGLLKIWGKAMMIFVGLKDYQLRFFVEMKEAKTSDEQFEPVQETAD